MPGLEEWDRRHQAALERIQQIGVVEPVGATIVVEGHEVEIVATCADCVQTAVIYRAPRGAMLFPEILWPPEAARGNSHGTMIGDLLMATFPAVQPHRRSIGLAFRSGGPSRFDEEGTQVTVPVDRAATAGYDRHLVQAVDPVEQDGLAISILDANVGMMSASIDVGVDVVDPDVLGFEFEWPHGFHRFGSGPGPEMLWRDWFPEQQGGSGNVVRRRLSSTMESVESVLGPNTDTERIQARMMPPRRPPLVPPRSQPREERPLSILERPSGTELHLEGSGGSGRRGNRQNLTSFRIEAPSLEATHLEVSLQSLYVHRFGGGDVVVLPPPPKDERRVEIGARVELDDGAVEFIAWERDPYNPGILLVVRMPSPNWCPDIRVIVGEESLSFRASRSQQETVYCRLMQRDAGVLERPGGIPVALRMIGRPINPVSFTIPLSAA